MNQVILAGAGGFIGNALIRELYSKNILVSAISRSYQLKLDSFLPERLNIITANLAALPLNLSIFNHPSLVVYMAGSTNLSLAEQNPVEDFKQHSNSLLALLSKINSEHRFLFLSSGGAVYGEPLNKRSSESDPLRPQSVYGSRNKILEEIVLSVCKQKNIDHMILRLANPFGLEQQRLRRKGLILSLMQSCLDNNSIKIRGNGEQKRDYFLAKDLCSFISLFANPKQDFPHSILNIGSGQSYSARQVVSLVTAFMNKAPNVEYQETNYPSDIMCSALNVSRLTSFLKTVDPGNASKRFVDLETSLFSLDLEKFYNSSRLV